MCEEHDFGEWVTIKEATKEAEGEAVRTCKVCGEKESKVLEKLKDDPKDPIEDDKKIEFNLNSDSKIQKIDDKLLKQALWANAETKVSEVLEYLTDTKDIVVKNKDGNEIKGDALVGSASTINLLKDGEVIDSYIIVVKGDVVGNGKVSAADARFVLRVAAKLEEVENDWFILACGLEPGGKISAGVARKILRVAAKLENF